MALKAKNFSNFFIDDCLIDIMIRQTPFKIRSTKLVQQNYFLLRHMVHQLHSQCYLNTVEKTLNTGEYVLNCDGQFTGQGQKLKEKFDDSLFFKIYWIKNKGKWKISKINSVKDSELNQ